MLAAFFDLDGTLTTTNVWRGYLEYFKAQRLRRATHLFFSLVHYPLYGLKQVGLLSESTFRATWSSHLAWYVRGMTIDQAAPIWEWVTRQFVVNTWRTDIRQILDQHKRRGDLVMLVSAGPEPLLARIGQELGADLVVGTRFGLHGDRYTGRTLSPVCIDEHKPNLAQQAYLARGYQVDLPASAAYADSITDLALLSMVGNPAAVYPDEALARHARQQGWRIYAGAG